MRFAIVESGGKQYRAVEGRTIEVDRLPVESGKQFKMERVLLMADGENVIVGTPTVDGIEVKVTVMDHIKGPKLISFKYRPKKRIRVKSGHRQQYTLLMVDFIGKPGEKRDTEKQETQVKAAKQPKAEKTAEAKKEAEAPSPKEKKSTAKKAPAKKTSTKKSTTTQSTKKKSEKK